MRLTELEAKRAKPGDREYKMADGGGLYLLVTPTGGKHWKWKYRVDGKEKKMPLGAYPEITLAEVRVRHVNARRLLEQGTDPMEERKAVKVAEATASSGSFQSAAEAFFDWWKGKKKAAYAESKWRVIKADILPALGHLPMTEIKRSDVIAVAKKVEARGASEVARRIIITINQIFTHAIDNDTFVGISPAANIKPSKILKETTKTNFAHLDLAELPELLRKIDVYPGTHQQRLATLLIAHTFVRTTELIHARWSEFDFDKMLWTIPALRMKKVSKDMKSHTVPLTTQTLGLLESLHMLTGDGELLFPGDRDPKKPMTINAIRKGLERMGYKNQMTGHGFRHMASTALNDNDFNSKHIEAQMSHQEPNAVTRAYNKAQYVEQRAKMMQWWSDYIDKARASASTSLRKLTSAA